MAGAAARDIAGAGVFGGAAGITGERFDHAGHLVEVSLDTGHAAAGEDRRGDARRGVLETGRVRAGAGEEANSRCRQASRQGDHKGRMFEGTQILAILKGNLPRPAVEIIAESGRKKMPLSVFW